jgi:hypothetical protein
MKREVIICDNEQCKKDEALHFNFFSERRLDGAGSSENWYFGFDLCQPHQSFLLRAILAQLDKGDRYLSRDKIIAILKEMKVKVIEE